nr:histo-blood group ABO system transferase isoform X2 [Symphalangus syndactylus]XP_055126502.1 histo-blood group ABO system transferase isoform X2 [Symphalangus syndactylus]
MSRTRGTGSCGAGGLQAAARASRKAGDRGFWGRSFTGSSPPPPRGSRMSGGRPRPGDRVSRVPRGRGFRGNRSRSAPGGMQGQGPREPGLRGARGSHGGARKEARSLPSRGPWGPPAASCAPLSPPVFGLGKSGRRAARAGRGRLGLTPPQGGRAEGGGRDQTRSYGRAAADAGRKTKMLRTSTYDPFPNNACLGLVRLRGPKPQKSNARKPGKGILVSAGKSRWSVRAGRGAGCGLGSHSGNSPSPSWAHTWVGLGPLYALPSVDMVNSVALKGHLDTSGVSLDLPSDLQSPTPGLPRVPMHGHCSPTPPLLHQPSSTLPLLSSLHWVPKSCQPCSLAARLPTGRPTFEVLLQGSGGAALISATASDLSPHPHQPCPPSPHSSWSDLSRT